MARIASSWSCLSEADGPFPVPEGKGGRNVGGVTHALPRLPWGRHGSGGRRSTIRDAPRVMLGATLPIPLAKKVKGIIG